MDRLYINDHFVVAVAGMFCLLITSVVSAQTATNLNCFKCVGPGEIRNNTVSWLNMDGAARGFLINQANDVADVKAHQSPIVLDGNDNEIGLLAGIVDGFGSIYVITQQGYILNDLSLATGATSSTSALFFEDGSCTSQAFAVTPPGFVQSTFDLTGTPVLSYVAKNSLVARTDVQFQSLSTASGCSGGLSTIPFAWSPLANDPVVTGISNQAYQLPIKIERPQ